ncbi:hypothetical protein LOTGIDRAFT_237068 [Lottia gigantea]|uniref:NADH dehydrogenase [ubiquinone] 1 beta subcomplex subunit 5, mitochondrial n=1 Tax=Lottia gigantea TaxID=225164 RepID=V4B266_LOTGI|nr:hypothetical protein LOTGIDRAFT_237068 [Lottia gigantea]ESO82349.1 hypothetical protein LOTGIDRAFT_237068 [Lottia gigantea]
MAGMSLLRPVLQRTFRAGFKLNGQNGIFSLPKLQTISVRSMAGKAKIVRHHTQFEWQSFKDDVWFWTMFWLVPVGLIMGYANFVVGQAELSDIPEGYEPKHYEYYKGPIERWFSKYIYDSYEYDYHKKMIEHIDEMEKLALRDREEKVKSLMLKKQDCKSWYYYPGDLQETVRARQGHDEQYAGINTIRMRK